MSVQRGLFALEQKGLSEAYLAKRFIRSKVLSHYQ